MNGWNSQYIFAGGQAFDGSFIFGVPHISQGEDPTISVDPDTKNPADGEAATAYSLTTLAANEAWEIDSYPAWVSGFNVSSGSETEGTAITCNLAANATGSSRQGDVVFKLTANPTVTATVTITQPTLTCSAIPTVLNFTYTGGTKDIVVTSNTDWTVVDDQTWISTSGVAGTGNDTFQVTCSSNGGAARSGTVTIIWQGINIEITINQDEWSLCC